MTAYAELNTRYISLFSSICFAVSIFLLNPLLIKSAYIKSAGAIFALLESFIQNFMNIEYSQHSKKD